MLLLLLIYLSVTQFDPKEGTLKTTFYFKVHCAAYPTLYAQIQTLSTEMLLARQGKAIIFV